METYTVKAGDTLDVLSNFDPSVVSSKHLISCLMIPRIIISAIGKRLYPKQYSILKTKLLEEYKYIQEKHERICNRTLEQILISGEDHRFRYHFGFDLIGILRALKNRVLYNKIEGASTIEQQLVRVLTNDFKRTFRRKIKEIFLATTLSELVPRGDIPLIYLYVAYYGAGMNGLEQAYQKLHIGQPKLISKEICAEIIARIKYPEPQKYSEKRLRQIYVRKMHLLSLYKIHSSYKKFKIYD